MVKQKTALIFGHSSGLGLALTKTLLEAGYQVVGVSRTSASITSESLIELAADLGNEEALAGVVATIRTQHADFDALVYTAGVLTAHEIDDLNYPMMVDLYRVNLFAPMLIESQLLDLIAQNGSDVVNVTSSSILDFYPMFSEYSTAKAALAKFTSDLRRRLQSSEARVMELCPSGFTSNMYARMTGDKIDRDESKQIDAADLARLVAYALDLPKVLEVGRLYVNRK
jgi:NADP-dependent 3-hydroxy acid dehydrogenase YdfG